MDRRDLADKGYAGQKNQVLLEARELQNGIIGKAWRNRPLSKRSKARNLLI